MPAFQLPGKHAIVTGAASGIGFNVAEVFADAGATVHVLDINQTAVEEAVKKINGRSPPPSGNCIGHVCDVTDEEVVKSVFGKIASGGRIDVLVNNAGISSVGDVLSTTGDEMERVFKVNVKGAFHCLKYAVHHMLADGKGGAITNLGSIGSLIGLNDRFAYSMSKGAILTMTYSVATDYVKKGIRCNAVCPGRVHTPFVDGYLAKNYPGKEAEMFQKLSEYQPLGRMGQPKELAQLILYLSSDEAGFVTGAAYPIDGGVTCRM
jgi:NAD(P)-dependent dehydrogenase (short-subunit alcohol dehydrogenase family)